MINKSSTARVYGEPTPVVKPQERVNIEMFKAIETLGRRLERVEFERDRLARRLATIEASATLDEKTGKFYLPVVVDPKAVYPRPASPRWTVAAALGSSALALCALVLSLHQQPEPLQLNARQMAALNALSAPAQLANLGASTGWKHLDMNGMDGEGAPQAAASTKETLPQADSVQETPAAVAQAPAAETSDGWQVVDNHLADAGKKPDVPQEKVAEPPPETAAATEAAPAAPEQPAARVTPPESTTATADAVPEATKTAAVEPPVAPSPAVEKPAETLAAEEAATAPPVAKVAETKAAPKEPTAPVSQKTAEEKPAPAPVTASSGAAIDPDTTLPSKLAEIEQRAFAGAPEAQHDLAVMYADGKLVAQDYKRAVYWFSKAADGGIANADYNLGVMFQQGMGVHQDVAKAMSWYEKAAQLGHPEAMYNLGIAYVEGVGASRDVERGVSYFKKAANAGVAQAAYNLGVLYESNFVGPIDLAKAEEWYRVAADQGHTDAKSAVERLHQQIAVAEKTGDQGLKLATAVEPAAGASEPEEYGEGDSSPLDSTGRAVAPGFGDALLTKVQAALIAHGALPGEPTGVLDVKTGDAIRSWELKLGLPVTGKPSQEFLDKITTAPASAK